MPRLLRRIEHRNIAKHVADSGLSGMAWVLWKRVRDTEEFVGTHESRVGPWHDVSPQKEEENNPYSQLI